MAFSTFSENAFQPMADLFEARVRSYGASFLLSATRRSLAWHRLSDPEKCHSLMREADCKDIEIHEEQLGYDLRSADEWWDIVWNTGIRRYVVQLSPENAECFQRKHLAEVNTLATPSGIRLDVSAIFALGRAR